MTKLTCRRIITILLCLQFVSCSTNRQIINHRFKIIELKEYYDGKGAIIPSTTGNIIPLNIEYKKIDLNIEQIKKAENILSQNINKYTRNILIKSELYYTLDSKGKDDLFIFYEKYIKRIMKKIKSFYRQYSGFSNNDDEIFIEIKLFNHNIDKFSFWADRYILPINKFVVDNTDTYFINLTKGEIENINFYHTLKDSTNIE